MSGFKNFMLQVFTWWNGQTMGTRFYTWRKGRFVGEDEAGNKYYQTADGSRRWVIYNGYADPTMIPPGWHGWMHHRTSTPPTEEEYKPHPWEKPHEPNHTGMAGAWHPSGSLYNPEPKSAARPARESWRPDQA